MVRGNRGGEGSSWDQRGRNRPSRSHLITLEESLKLAAKAYAFEPDDANTWVTMKEMIRNFLMGIWKRGGLAGTVPDDAFAASLGLGETMTPEDILEGILRITALAAVVRRAVTISLLDESGAPNVFRTLANAWPTKITATHLKSDSNEVAIETIEMTHEDLTISND